MTIDFYLLLGVSLTATEAEIKHAFRQQAKLFHPDVNKSPEAVDRFRMLYIAYDTLMDPFKRKMYDRLLQQERTPMRQTFSKAYYETMQRRADMRARQYARMQYDEFEETAFTKAAFHAKQLLAFLIFFAMMCAAMAAFIIGFHYVFYENFNGAQVTGYGFWAMGAALAYISGKALLGIFDIWRT